MDPDNPVVALCANGMQAEMDGDLALAKSLFKQAWDGAADDYERCVAAHYVARHQATPEMTLHWNQECMRLADQVGGERVAGFYPSLLLNIGHSHEVMGATDRALAAYAAAEERLTVLGEGPYADMVRDGVARGLERITADAGRNGEPRCPK